MSDQQPNTKSSRTKQFLPWSYSSITKNGLHCCLIFCLFFSCSNLLLAEPIRPTQRALDLSADLTDSELKSKLQSCSNGPFYKTDFSIAHRGAPLGYPEHSREGYIAAAEQGAGRIECDVTFTKDLQLVCRHSQCDLATSTNILQTELAKTCNQQFRPASKIALATARCCTSDITLAQFKTLCARSDTRNPQAKNVDEYLVPLNSPVVETPIACATVLSHKESIALIDALGRKFIPELKRSEVDMPFANGFNQRAYADKMIGEYKAMNIDPKRVFPQSFDIKDVRYWLEAHPHFAQQAIWLDPRGRQRNFIPSLKQMQALKAEGINIISPPIPMLLQLNNLGAIEPSDYARYAKQAGLEIITWTLESGDPVDPNFWLYASIAKAMDKPGRMLEVLNVLAKEVGVQGIFSDWPGTVTYYDNCLNR